jgi:hypothetical protein
MRIAREIAAARGAMRRVSSAASAGRQIVRTTAIASQPVTRNEAICSFCLFTLFAIKRCFISERHETSQARNACMRRSIGEGTEPIQVT